MVSWPLCVCSDDLPPVFLRSATVSPQIEHENRAPPRLSKRRTRKSIAMIERSCLIGERSHRHALFCSKIAKQKQANNSSNSHTIACSRQRRKSKATYHLCPAERSDERRCDSEEDYVRRLSTCDTPLLPAPGERVTPQLPVPIEYTSAFVMRILLMMRARSMLSLVISRFSEAMVSLRKR